MNPQNCESRILHSYYTELLNGEKFLIDQLDPHRFVIIGKQLIGQQRVKSFAIGCFDGKTYVKFLSLKYDGLSNVKIASVFYSY